jgi:hypothetical protein
MGWEWPDRRGGQIPVARAILTVSDDFPQTKNQYVDIIKERLDLATRLKIQPDGT